MPIGPAKYVSNFGRKFIRQAWLHEEPGTALMLGAFSQRWSTVAGEQDDRYVSRSRLALQVLNELPAVTVAERQVGDDDVRMNFPCPAAGFPAISSPDCLETEQDKALDVELTRVVVIVYDEYQWSDWRVPGTAAIHGFVYPSKKPKGENIATQRTDLSGF